MEGIGEYDCLEQVCKSDRDAAKGGQKKWVKFSKRCVDSTYIEDNYDKKLVKAYQKYY